MYKSNKIFSAALGALLLVGVLAGPARAALDELILEDTPYYAGPAVEYNDTGSPGTEAAPAAAGTGQYTVCPGDTLIAIAGRFGVDVHNLAALNQLSDRDFIREGQVLKIPGGLLTHRVEFGQTLWDIARRYGVSIEQVASINRIADRDHLVEGQKLIIPPDGAPAPVANISRGMPLFEKMNFPVVGWISSPFGIRDGRPHEGVDIAADSGEPIKAAKAGRVVFSGPRGTYGLTVIIDHGDGLRTLYAHSSKLLVAEGEWVDAGQTIALVGSTGRSTGPHLHMEVLYHGTPCDPMLFMESAYA